MTEIRVFVQQKF